MLTLIACATQMKRVLQLKSVSEMSQSWRQMTIPFTISAVKMKHISLYIALDSLSLYLSLARITLRIYKELRLKTIHYSSFALFATPSLSKNES